MTYEEFLANNKREQLRYITEEDARMKKAAKLWQKYDAAMKTLGLHPLTGFEIDQRQRQLRRMRADTLRTHGADTEGNRAVFTLIQRQAAVSAKP